MHVDEIPVSPSLVSRLVTDQFPQWTGAVTAVPSGGTDHALFRLGEDKVVRLPRIAGAVGRASLEMRWLPFLAPHLPLAVPTPLALGTPAFGYPHPWSIYRWLPGSTPPSPCGAAELASFLSALHSISPADGPPAAGRGGPLAPRDPHVRQALAELDGEIDTALALSHWESALAAPSWTRPPVWVHGDLHSANLLAVEGKLTAVLDWGCLCVGDPAVDLMVAWTFLDAAGRDVLRAALPYDDAAWERGRGWALSLALIALPYYRFTNPVLTGISRFAIDQVLYPTERTR